MLISRSESGGGSRLILAATQFRQREQFDERRYSQAGKLCTLSDSRYRHRKNLGDLRVLAESIAEIGLLHPVVVTPGGCLIAGQRRLAACRLLGWTEVPATVVDLDQAAHGEAHENFVRKDLLPSEIVALKRAIEPLERRAARERQGRRADLAPAAAVGRRQGDTRDKIVGYFGVGRTTIERAEAFSETTVVELTHVRLCGANFLICTGRMPLPLPSAPAS